MFRDVPSAPPADTSLRHRVARTGRPLVFAHRGSSAGAPENSLAALRRAVDEGADGVEFDVQRCGSGELVVFHDRTLGRCLGVTGQLRDTPLSTLRSLTLDPVDRRAGRAPSGERVPTLDEWLAAAPKELLLNLEAKVEVAADASLGQACADALEAAGRTSTSVLSCFHPAGLASAAARNPVPRGTLVDVNGPWRTRLALGLATRPAAVHPHHALVTPGRVALWHRLGLAVFVWTVDNPDVARRCLDAGVDGLITNVPAVMRPVCEAFRRGS